MAITYKAGLTAAQKASISSLAAKPTASWTPTDRANWAYATNNAPLPSSTLSSAPLTAPKTESKPRPGPTIVAAEGMKPKPPTVASGISAITTTPTSPLAPKPATPIQPSGQVTGGGGGGSWGSAPTAAPSPSAPSASTPTATGAPPASTGADVAAPAPSSTPASPAPTGGAVAPKAATSSNPTGYANALNGVLSHFKSLGPLQDQRNLLLKAIYDKPLTPEELRTLSPAQQKAVRDSDRSMLDYQVMTLNDTIKGRGTEYDSAIKYALEGYKMEQEALEKKKEQTYDLLKTLASDYGSLAGMSQGALQRIMDGSFTEADLIELSKYKAASSDLPASAREYEYAVSQGYKGTYEQYQNEDANRKALATLTSGMTTSQQSAFMSITNKFQADTVMKQADKGAGLVQIADQVIANPKDATNQLKALYGLVKNLDPDSAVREGEVQLAQKTQSYLQKWGTDLERVFNGVVISPDVAKNLAVATKELAQAWFDTAARKTKQYQSQANVAGVGSQFDQYLSGFDQPANIDTGTGELTEEQQKAFDTLKSEFPDLNDQEIRGLLGFSGGGSVPNNAQGSLSEKYESGGNPGAIGYDSTGGLSYGKYQLAHQNAKRFVEQSPYASDFKGIAFNSQAWQNKWKEVAKKDPDGFGKAQHQYIKKTHFDPQVNRLAKAGISVGSLSPTLRDVIWSTAVQHGANTDIVEKALKKVGAGAREEDIIRAIYEERWGGGRRFASSTPAVQKAVYNRFFGKDGEMNRALAMSKSNLA